MPLDGDAGGVALGSTFASSGTVCGAAMSNTQVAVRAELVNLSREDLMQRCIALQDQLADSGKAMVGQPQYFMTPEGYMLWARAHGSTDKRRWRTDGNTRCRNSDRRAGLDRLNSAARACILIRTRK